jgi:hypothetical protein
LEGEAVGGGAAAAAGGAGSAGVGAGAAPPSLALPSDSSGPPPGGRRVALTKALRPPPFPLGGIVGDEGDRESVERERKKTV